MISDKKIKTIYSGSNIMTMYSLRLFLLIILITGLVHIKENPIVILIIGLVIVLILFMMSGDNIIVLYSDRLVFRTTYYGLWNNDIIYKIDDIHSVKCIGDYTLETDITAQTLPRYQRRTANTIQINLNNGDLKEHNSFIYKDKLIDLLDDVNEIKKNKNKKAGT